MNEAAGLRSAAFSLGIVIVSKATAFSLSSHGFGATHRVR
jgi:hypothetical protein